MERMIQLMNRQKRLIVGVMSGTSLDGVDIALVRLNGSGLDLHIEPMHFSTYPMPTAWRRRLQCAFDTNTEEICRINFDLGFFFGDLIKQFYRDHAINRESVDAIGMHGQTLYHVDRHSTLQSGEADVVAELTGTPVISDFRTADVAVGGAGAPLVPYLDQILFKNRSESIALQNIGGIGNVTFLPRDIEDDILAFDTGPGNAILNELVETITNGEHNYDSDGHYSNQGKSRADIRRKLLDHPYFSQPLPKSTGRELFGRTYVRQLLGEYASVPPLDMLRTCVELIAQSIAVSYERFLPRVDKVYISGGGAHHPLLMANLKQLLGEDKVEPLRAVQEVTVDSKEAVAFAVLANEAIHGHSGNLPQVTGASQPKILGKFVPP